MASARVAALRSCPRTADVVVRAPGLRMPRADMHMCSASTIAPRASSMRIRASAICPVSRSWTWKRRAYTSTRRASLDSPVTLPCAAGM